MSSTQNGLQKSMENIKATEQMKQNTLRYLEAQRTNQKRNIFQQRPYAALRYAMAVVCVFFDGWGRRLYGVQQTSILYQY